MTADVTVTVAGVRWTLAPAGRALLGDQDLRLEDHLAAGRAQVVKHGAHRTVYRITPPAGGSRSPWPSLSRSSTPRGSHTPTCTPATCWCGRTRVGSSFF